MNFDKKTEKEIQAVEDWINNYPRRIHRYHTAAECFVEEIKKMGLIFLSGAFGGEDMAVSKMLWYNLGVVLPIPGNGRR